MSNCVRWGLIGAGRIARGAMAPAISHALNSELRAVASRNAERREALAADQGVTVTYESYEALLADPEIDAVYISLPNGLHEEWTVAAARAGKHVLCEKALTFTVESAMRMREACEQAGVLLVEAYMYRHHPQWAQARRLLEEGRIGEVRQITATFTGNLPSLLDHRWSAALGRGALFDVTCYGINVCRYLLGAEPRKVTAMADLATEEGVDRASTVLMSFPKHVTAVAHGSLSSAGHQDVHVIGTHGTLEIPLPFIPELRRCPILVQTPESEEKIYVAPRNHFILQVEHFAACVLDRGHDRQPAEDGVLNTRVCEAAVRSWETAMPINPGDLTGGVLP